MGIAWYARLGQRATPKSPLAMAPFAGPDAAESRRSARWTSHPDQRGARMSWRRVRSVIRALKPTSLRQRMIVINIVGVGATLALISFAMVANQYLAFRSNLL